MPRHRRAERTRSPLSDEASSKSRETWVVDGTQPLGLLSCIVLDCADPARMTRFYQGVLGGVVEFQDQTWGVLQTTSGATIAFQRVIGYVPPTWPDPKVPSQAHLDIAVPDLDRARTRMKELGASFLKHTGESIICADPAGHPICLCR